MGGQNTHALPTGTVTFLFSDIEGSTRLLQDLGDSYEAALSEHRKLLRAAFEEHNGHEMGTEGDSFFVSFARASDAVAAALEGQLVLGSHAWEARPIRVRMGVHTGEAQLVDRDYVGLAVHQAARISSAAHGGQVLVSQTTRDLVAASLPEGATLVDLGEHRLKDLAQPTRLYNLAHAGLQAELPPPRTLSVLPNNLPLQLTTFVGRDEEIGKITKLLDSTRLLSLLGAGGSGKTRLALQVAADLVTEYRDGVWLADLAPITDPELVMRGFAEALGVREEKDRSIDDVLIEFLQGKELLVVVDNCEHLAEASAEVVDRLLHAASGLMVMATSREPLGAEGETVFRVPSLDTPKGDEPVEELGTCEAIRLFCDRASRATADFGLTPDNAHPVSEICRRLDGMPLAIELAAARVRMLTPQEIAKRLDDRFKLLTGGLKTGIRRQQTLRAAVDWSYEMLTDAEQLLFRRLSVFVGGFTLAAAEGVCAADGIDEGEVFDLLGNLVDRSLVLAEPHDGTTRYRLLETMREYGRETLATSGEAPAVWSRHLTWFADLAEEAGVQLLGIEEPVWLARLDTELDNIRQALRWAESGGNPVDGLRLAASLYKYWQVRWYVAEGLRWTKTAFEASQDIPDALRGKALVALGFLSMNVGQPEKARPYQEECIGLPRTPETTRWIAEATNDYGILVWFMDNDYERSMELLQEALRIREEIGFRPGIRESLNNVGQGLRWVGKFDEARELFERALVLSRELGAQAEIAFGLSVLAGEYERDGNYQLARSYNEEALEIRRTIGDRAGEADSLRSLGAIARHRGELARARELSEEAFEVCRDQDNVYGMQDATAQLGMIDIEQGRYDEARRRFEEAVKATEEIGSPIFRAIGNVYLANVDRVVGDLEEARRLNEESLEFIGDAGMVAVIRIRLGMIARYHGDLGAARQILEENEDAASDALTRCLAKSVLGLIDAAEGRVDEALAKQRDALDERIRLGFLSAIPGSLEAFGAVAVAQGQHERGAQLLGAAEELRAAMGSVIYPIDRPEHDEAVARARTELGDDAFDAAWAKGRSMSTDEAVAFALEA